MKSRAIVLLACVLLGGCTFNWGSEGIEDVKLGGRSAAEVGASGDPATATSTPRTDTSTNADASAPASSGTNADAGASTNADSAGKKSSGWFSWLFGDDESYEEQTTLIKLAILPVAWRDEAGLQQACDLCAFSGEMKPTGAKPARLVTGFIYEAVARHPRVLFPTPDMVEGVISATPARSMKAGAAALAAAGRADFVIASALLELRPRVGPDDDPEKPAGAALYVALVDARSGEIRWSDTYDENESGRGMVLGAYDKVINDRPIRWSSAEGYSEVAVDELIEDLIDELP